MIIGVMGAGQLGQMLALAGNRLGHQLRFLSPDPDAPAGRFAELIVADYENEEALAHFADGLDVATYEFESIPASAVVYVAERVPTYPPPLALETAQDRAREKECFARLGIPTAPFEPVSSMTDVRNALARTGLPAMLKSRRFGYDGKGQAILRSRDDIGAGWVKVGGVPSIVESVVEFTRELSIIAVRSRGGEMGFYPLVENHHSEGILRFSLAPAPGVAIEMQRKAEEYATRVMDSLRYVGVLAIELFETAGGLVANEMAPRVHNTGHWTIEGADTSQFENHLRAIAGMRIGSTDMGGAAGMVNVIGQEPDVGRLRDVENVHIHMYGKAPKPRRKLGHITVTADDLDGVRNSVARLRHALSRQV
ncbi:MAG TPA: 5-(carboxyamino)imidazole ribonucleotide synthase [Gemmatimonadaceae bacterium]|nr:5-(carboxyamino)imidazole ribonucleotide synthase [Gemmatimonadaceae bacterium]